MADEESSAESEGGKKKKKMVFKILVVGNSKCGKSSFINRYTTDSFESEYTITVGCDYTKKVVKWEDGSTIRLQLWDIAGQDRFASLTRPFYRNAKAAVVLCDVGRPGTLAAVESWKKELDEKCSVDDRTIPTILIANKADLIENGVEALEIGARIENLCSTLHFDKWFITSAKSNRNIEEAMNYLLRRLMENKKPSSDSSTTSSSSTTDEESTPGGFKLGGTTTQLSDPALDPSQSADQSSCII